MAIDFSSQNIYKFSTKIVIKLWPYCLVCAHFCALVALFMLAARRKGYSIRSKLKYLKCRICLHFHFKMIIYPLYYTLFGALCQIVHQWRTKGYSIKGSLNEKWKVFLRVDF